MSTSYGRDKLLVGAAVLLCAPVFAETDNNIEDVETIQVVASVESTPKETHVYENKIAGHQPELIKDILRDIPGVDVGGTNGFNQQIYIRSVSDKGINVTIDGARQMGDVFHHGGNLLIDPALLKQVDVSVGANSVVHGSGALGGAVKFTTVDASDLLRPGERYGARVKTGYDTNNDEWSNSLTLFGRVADRVDLLGYISHSDYDYGESGDGTRIGADGKDKSYLVKAGVDLFEGQKIKVSAERVKSDGEYPFRAEFSYRPTTTANFQDYTPQRFTRETQTLSYEAVDGSGWVDLNVAGYHTKNELDRSQPHKNMAAAIRSGKANASVKKRWNNQDGGWVTSVETWGINVDNRSEFQTGAFGHTLRVGYEWFQTKNHRDDYQYSSGRKTASWDGEKGTSNSGYLENAVQLGGLTLTPGIRYDHYRADMLGDEDQTFTEFSKAFGAEYRFESGVGLVANYTELFRAPDTTESIRVNSGKFNQKNQLEPETGENKEVGIFFDHRGLIVQEDTFSLVGKYFRTHYDNLIVQTAVPGVSELTERFNAGNAVVDGYEASVNYAVNNIITRFSYSHISTDYTSPLMVKGVAKYGDILGRDTGDKYTVGLTYLLPKYDLSLHWNSLFYTRYKDEKTKKPGYGVNDLAVEWAPASGTLDGLTVSLGLYNIFDKNYVSHTSRNSYGVLGADYEPGRSFRASVAYQF